MRPLNLNRHYVMRKNARTGKSVCMYKDDPGVYFDPNGNLSDEQEAIDAGYDIESGKRDRLRQELTAKAMSDVDAKMARIEQDVDEMVDAAQEAPAEAPAQPVTVVSDRKPPTVTTTNAKGMPRETERRKMEGGRAGRWTVVDKATGKSVHGDKLLDTESAEQVLLERAV